jgi:hypothetical protein
VRRASLLAALAALLAAGCVSDEVREIAKNVVTLQRGSVSELARRRGRGPFREYDLPPEAMLEVVEDALGRARGLGGLPLAAIFPNPVRREVVAKERTPDRAHDDAYAPAFRSAVLVGVDPLPGRPGRSRVEIHATHRGPFHRGAVAWERDLPRWIDETLAERGPRLAPIPGGPGEP